MKVQKVKKSKINIRPKVSIIIPVFNGEKYVSLAIDSALRQTYDNIEVIVVNDGSTDNTEKICTSYGNKIRYIKKQNGGVSTALNIGIQAMTGDYFSWLSHDDLYFPEKIEKEVSYLEKNNLFETNTILYSDYCRIDETGNLIDNIVLDDRALNRDSALAILKGGINGLTLLIPKNAFKEAGMFDEKLYCIQDYKLWFELYKNRYKFIHLPEILTITRLHPEQTTNTNSKVIKEGNDFWLNVFSYFKDEDKIRLYGSVYEYFYESFKFFDKGPYDKVIQYCKEQYTNIENANEDTVKQTKVSVVIPFYNDINSTVRAIKSVLNQTHKNIEIIIINNASTDNISEINRIINENDEIIKFISYKEKQNKITFWNEGVTEAIGEYIVLFDQYSVMEKNRIEVQLAKMVASNVPISCTSYYEKYNDKSDLINCGFEDGYMVHKLINNCYYKMPATMIRKDYLVENKIINNDLKGAEDLIVFLKILIDNRILGINEPLNIIYKQNENLDIESKIALIVSYVVGDKRFCKYPDEVSVLLNTYKELIDARKYCKENIQAVEQEHKEELKRYAYMQTDEFKAVNKIRKASNRMCLKKQIPIYKLDTNAIINSRINRIYKRLKKR